MQYEDSPGAEVPKTHSQRRARLEYAEYFESPILVEL
jgi:hypothetical protein